MTAGDDERVGGVLDALAAALAGDDAPPARQEARDLIAAVLDVQRFWPTANRATLLTAEQRARIAEAAERLARGMPMAYATRRAAFRTLSLYVDERVLIPRPETEVMVDLVLDTAKQGGGVVIDVGTGSGAIALALAVEGRFGRVVATDISADALTVARLNGESVAARHDQAMAGVEFRLGSFLAPCAGERADVVVANPPYISRTEADELPASVRDWEPAIALFSDDDGMAAIAAIAREAAGVLGAGGLLALEVDSRRAGRAAETVAAVGAFRDVAMRPDLTGRARFVLARRTEA
jgi:release factor glutamine methyltransferase